MITPEEIDSMIGAVDASICTLAGRLDPDTAFSLGCEWRAVLSYKSLSREEVAASLAEVREILRGQGQKALPRVLDALAQVFD